MIGYDIAAVGVGGGVLDAGTEGEDAEFEFGEEGGVDGGTEVGSKTAMQWEYV